MPDMITGTAGVSPVRLLHPDPEAARSDDRLQTAGWTSEGDDLLGPEGVFAVDMEAAGLRVKGVVALFEVSDPPQGAGLLPHEQTDARAVRRRARALRSAHVDRDPLLLTHRGRGRVGRLVAGRTTPAYEIVDGDRHVLVRQVDPVASAAVLDLLREGRYLVADGHHRLAGAVELRREGVETQVTGLLVDADETPLDLGPIHRVLLDSNGRGLLEAGVVSSVLERCRAVGAHVDPSPLEAGTLMLGDDTSVVLVHGVDRWTVSWPQHPRSDVTTLVEHVLEDTHGARTRREPDIAEALASAGAGALAALLPAPDLDDILRLAERGVLLPYKATAFEPKLPTGALVRPLTP